MTPAEAHSVLTGPEWRIAFSNQQARLGRNTIERLTWMQNNTVRRPTRLPRCFHEVWFALAQDLRDIADLNEFLAMRDLHEYRGHSFAQLVRDLGLDMSRQSMYQRFGNLGARFGSDR